MLSAMHIGMFASLFGLVAATSNDVSRGELRAALAFPCFDPLSALQAAMIDALPAQRSAAVHVKIAQGDMAGLFGQQE